MSSHCEASQQSQLLGQCFFASCHRRAGTSRSFLFFLELFYSFYLECQAAAAAAGCVLYTSGWILLFYGLLHENFFRHICCQLWLSTDKYVTILVLPPVVQVPGVVNGSLLATLISSVEEELEGTEWATRKAAADTLACLATALGPALSTAKASCTAALVTCRFDKVFLKSSSSSCIHFSFSPNLFPSFGFLSLDMNSSVTTDLGKSTFPCPVCLYVPSWDDRSTCCWQLF